MTLLQPGLDQYDPYHDDLPVVGRVVRAVCSCVLHVEQPVVARARMVCVRSGVCRAGDGQ